MYWFFLLDIAGNWPVKLLCMVLLALCILIYTLFILFGFGAYVLIWIVWPVGYLCMFLDLVFPLLVHLPSPLLIVPLDVLSSYVLLLFCQTLGSVFLTFVLVSLDHVMKFPTLMAFIHVVSTGNPAAVWRYLMDWGIDGKLYTFCTSSLSFSLSFDTDNFHSFSV